MFATSAVCIALFIRESRVEVARRRYDPVGAVAITGSIVLLVYSISKAPDVGWATGRTIGLLIAAAVLLAVFLVTETRVAEPLMPFSIWRLATVRAGNLVGVALGAIMFSTFFLFTLYTQQVLGYSPLQTCAAMLATGGTTSPGFNDATGAVLVAEMWDPVSETWTTMAFHYPWWSCIAVFVVKRGGGKAVLTTTLRVRQCPRTVRLAWRR